MLNVTHRRAVFIIPKELRDHCYLRVYSVTL